MSDLYDRDFLLWTEEQATALRRAKGANLPLDWENRAEEIESLGKSDRRALHSHTRRILRHLLKLTVSPAEGPRRGWALTIREARNEIAIILQDSPSLRRVIDMIIADEATFAAELAAGDLEEHELAPGVRDRLRGTGFTADQVVGD